jgi:polyisoprenyl-phosphate glycosyltransferase
MRPIPNHPLSISLIVPVLNEAEAIRPFLERVESVFTQHPELTAEIVFVNDGSTDSTLSILLSEQSNHPHIRVIDLSRSFGKEAALSAGLHDCTGQVVVPIDVDLQDPPELIPQMVEKWRQGFEVVLAHRAHRRSDSWAKQTSASWFYRLHNKISDPKLPENVGDFRLMDRCVVEALKHLPETRRFMKGLFAWLGFKTTQIDYERPQRQSGQSKFNGWKLWNFALEGVTSFSTSPLRLWTYLGLLVSGLSFLFAMFIVVRVLVAGVDTPGYASLMVAVTFLGGLQLIGIGVLGEYLGRTYMESKRRPMYIIRRVYEKKPD